MSVLKLVDEREGLFHVEEKTSAAPRLEMIAAPPVEEGLKKEGVLSKRVQTSREGFEWCARYVTLTKDKLYIRNEEGGKVRDSIPLLEITSVKKMSGHMDLVATQHSFVRKALTRMYSDSDAARHAEASYTPFTSHRLQVDSNAKITFAITPVQGTTTRRIQLACEQERDKDEWCQALLDHAKEKGAYSKRG